MSTTAKTADRSLRTGLRGALLALALCASPSFAAWDEAVEAYNKGDYALAAKEFRPFAEQGQAVAQYILGWILQNGEGVPQDHAQAAKWYLRSAEKGNLDAQYAIGSCYMSGQGVDRSDAEAARWMRKAAEQGKAAAQYLLGYLLTRGEGVTHSESEGAAWYRKAAEQGYADAQYAYGLALGSGAGVEKEEAESNQWLRKAAEQGHTDAAYLLAWNLEKGVGALPDYDESAKWYAKAADAGNVEARFHLGLLYRDGRGVEKDEARALELLKLAAAAGQPGIPGTIDDYLKAGGFDAAFALTDTWLQKSPDDAQLLTLVAFAAVNEARSDAVRFGPPARGYGEKAIGLIEADRRPPSLTPEEWGEYRNRWLPQLYLRLGALSQKTGAAEDARQKLERATVLDPKDPYGWYLLGQSHFAEYELITAAAKALDGQEKSDAIARAFAALDRVIDTYARAVGLAEADEKSRDLREPLLRDLQGVYEFRNGNRNGLEDILSKYRSH